VGPAMGRYKPLGHWNGKWWGPVCPEKFAGSNRVGVSMGDA
jgi:hypothetical protein